MTEIKNILNDFEKFDLAALHWKNIHNYFDLAGKIIFHLN